MKSPSEKYPHLIDPRALLGPRFIGHAVMKNGPAVAQSLEDRAAQVAAIDIEELPTLAIIQGRPVHKALRKLNGKQLAERVIRTAESINAQQFAGKLSVVATVDANGFEPTLAQSERLLDLGVGLLTQRPDQSVAGSINHTVGQNRTGLGVIVPIYGGNRLATDQALRAASLHVGNGAVGAFGARVMDAGPMNMAYSVLSGDSSYYDQFVGVDTKPSHRRTGFMSDAGVAANAVMLSAHPLPEDLDPRATGLNRWAAEHRGANANVVYDPALSVHDSIASVMTIGALLEEANWSGER